ncbi:unnamed protein product, partial [Prorocentrum cordatum]
GPDAGAEAEEDDWARWSAPEAAGGSALGLERRVQLVDGQLARLVAVVLRVGVLTLELQSAVASCGAGEPAAVAVRLGGLAFLRDTVCRLRPLERRCLGELGLLEDDQPSAAPASPAAKPGSPARGAAERGSCLPLPDEPKGEDPPAACISTLSLGSASALWREGGGGAERQLLQLAPPRGRAVLVRWKEGPPAAGAEPQGDQGWHPIEGCVHGARVVLHAGALAALGAMLSRCASPLERLQPPPLESGWMRLAVHDTRVELPSLPGGAHGAPALPGPAVAVPALLLTSVPGLGELFHALEVLPQRLGLERQVLPPPLPALVGISEGPRQRPRPDAPGGPLGLAGPREGVLCEQALISQGGTPGSARELAGGAVRVGEQLAPSRSPPHARAWVAELVGGRRLAAAALASCWAFLAKGNVDVSRCVCFSSKVQEQLAAEQPELARVRWQELVDLVQAQVSSEALAQVLPELSAAAEEPAGAGAAVAGAATAPQERQSPAKASRHRRAPDPEGEAEALASEWASLQWEVQRLREDRRRVDARLARFHAAADAGMARSEARAAEWERAVAAAVAQERGAQAELSARGEAAPKPRGAWVQGPPRAPQKPAAPPLSDAQVAAYARMSEEDFAAVAGDLSAKARARVANKRALDHGEPQTAARAARLDADVLQQQVAQAQAKLDRATGQAAKAMQHGGAAPPVSASEACKQIEALVAAVQATAGVDEEARRLTALVKMLRDKLPADDAASDADVPMAAAPDWSYFTDPSGDFFSTFVEPQGGVAGAADDEQRVSAAKKIPREAFESLVKQMQEHHVKKARTASSEVAGQQKL